MAMGGGGCGGGDRVGLRRRVISDFSRHFGGGQSEAWITIFVF
jgi:hypothetical protein